MKTLLTLLLMTGICLAEPIKFDELNGYENVTVTKILGDGIRIIHSAGARTIPASELSPELRERFGITEKTIKNSEEEKALNKKAALNVLGVTDFEEAIAQRRKKLEKATPEAKVLLQKEIVLLWQKQYAASMRPVSGQNGRKNGEKQGENTNPAKIRPNPATQKRDPFKRPKRGLDSDFKLK